MNELRSRVQVYEESSVDKIVVTRLENKIRDLEAKLDLEITTKHRLEVCELTCHSLHMSCDGRSLVFSSKVYLCGVWLSFWKSTGKAQYSVSCKMHTLYHNIE